MANMIHLDWQKLLGFDQAPAQITSDAASIADPRAAQLGTKLGGKVGNKDTGFAVGPNALSPCLRARLGIKVGGKVGGKPIQISTPTDGG